MSETLSGDAGDREMSDHDPRYEREIRDLRSELVDHERVCAERYGRLTAQVGGLIMVCKGVGGILATIVVGLVIWIMTGGAAGGAA